MKIIVIGVLALVVSIMSTNALAQEKQTTYKCYVEFAGDEDGIQFVRVKPSEVNRINNILLDGPVYVVGHRRKANIENVVECVKDSQSFVLGRAQLLDAATAR